MKSGLNFYTTNIINSADEFKTVEEGEVIRIANLEFRKEFKIDYTKEDASDPVMAKASIDLTSILTGNAKEYYRIDMYVVFEGAEPFIGSNFRDTQKGIPFWVEFNGASAIADIKKAIDKTKTFVIDTPIVNTSVSGKTITFEAAQEYVRFKKVEVLKFDDESEYSEPTAVTATINPKGANGFGTYSYLIKNITLPTAVNTSWTTKAVMPIVGAKYDQYIVTMEAPAANGSMQHVGGRVNSETTHVFWVKDDISESFATLLDSVKPDTEEEQSALEE